MNTAILPGLQHLIESFATIIATRNLTTFKERIPLASWQNQLDRLQAWPPMVKYSGDDSVSLDYWLRDSQSVYTHLLWLIGGLERLIDRLLRFSNNHSSTDETKHNSNNLNICQDSQSLSEKELLSILSGISRTADSLYQMQRAIERPAPESLLSGISKAHIKSYEHFDKDHIKDKHPQADQKLIDRLGYATSKRRAILKYRADERSNKGKSSFGDIQVRERNLEDPIKTNSANLHSSEAYTTCPHCHFTIKSHQDWTDHVFQDILPYTCLAKDCETPSKLYTSCDIWYSHLIVKHHGEFPCDAAYKCPLCAANLQDPEARIHLASHLEAIAVFALPEMTQYKTSQPLDTSEQRQSILKMNTLMGDLIERRKAEAKKGTTGTWQRKELPAVGESLMFNKKKARIDHDDGNFQAKITEDENREKERILSALSPFAKPKDLPAQESETETCIAQITHQFPDQTFGYATKPEPWSAEDHSKKPQYNPLWEGKTGFYGAPPVTAMDKASPSLEESSIEILECDVCYSIFHGVSAAESHSIEEGHTSFVDITEEFKQRSQEIPEVNPSDPPIEDKDAKISNGSEAFRRALWDDYPKTLTDIMNPEDILKTQGIHDVMETQMRHAIRRLEQDLDPNDEAVLDMVRNLADVLREQGQLEEAEKLYLRAFKESRAAKGISSPITLNNLRSLAALLYEKEDNKQAETKFRQVVAGLERIKGVDDKNTIDVVHDLAQTLRLQLGFEEAEMLFRRAWIWRKDNLGPTHPDTLSSLQEIAICLQRRGDYSAAEVILRDALLTCETTFGKDDFETLKCVFNLSRVVYQQERYSEARTLDKRILKARKKVLKADTALSLDEIYNKSINLRYQGKLRAAEHMARRAVDGLERLQGRDSEKTLVSLNSLGVALRQQGRLNEAVELMTEVAEGLEKIHGRHDFEVQKAFLNLANIWGTMGRHQTTEKLLARELEPARESQGRDNPLVVAIIINLASSICAQGRLQSAVRLLEEEIEWLEKLLTERTEHVMKKRITISKTIVQLKDHIEYLSSASGHSKPEGS